MLVFVVVVNPISIPIMMVPLTVMMTAPRIRTRPNLASVAVVLPTSTSMVIIPLIPLTASTCAPMILTRLPLASVVVVLLT
jgi:hypothetical protein